MDVLVADDHPVTRELLKLNLERWGYRVILACDGEEAWGALQSRRIDLALLDWMMPGFTGPELCRRVREAGFPEYIYIIILTSRDDRNDIRHGLAAGADDYITKPFDNETLRLRLRAAHRLIQLQHQLRNKNAELSQLNRRLSELVSTDSLMRIGNRRSFDDALARMHDQAVRYRESYGLILCDVDHFKSYNDTYGHMAGDATLRTLGSLMGEILRASDQAFRYGGEELAVIAPAQREEGAIAIAERIRSRVQALSIEHSGSRESVVTLSCGVTVFSGGQAPVEAAEVVKRADVALYRAKMEGRNRIALAEVPPAAGPATENPSRSPPPAAHSGAAD